MSTLRLVLHEVGQDKTTDLYKALTWVKNCSKRGESSFTLPDFEFKSTTTLHNQLVVLGYRAMIYTTVATSRRYITVWW